MHALSVSLLAVLQLTLAGCGEKAVVEKPVATAAVQAKGLTPEEKFAEMKLKAEAGDAIAQFDLGLMYVLRNGVSEDNGKANEWMRKAATQFELFQKLAAQGDARAQLGLGWMYALGEGVPVDAAKAFEWVQKAAVQGDVPAQVFLSKLYADGTGVPKNPPKALEWMKKVAEQGYAMAQEELGDMYARGVGVQKNASKALEWFQKAADQGDAEMQFNLGDRYRTGYGIPKNPAKAVEWLQKAASQGYAEAQYSLRRMYAKGDGVPKDAAKAFEWTQKAAAQGGDFAQLLLGWAYWDGDGVGRNRVLAYAWVNLAAAQESSYSEYRDRYESQLTPAQRAEGQRLASNWKKGDILQAASSDSSGFASLDGILSKQGTGTAFAVSSEGHALTNHHVINGCAEVKISGREGIAKVITSDSVNDLALLQLPGKTRDVASLNPDPGKLRQGEDIVVFGYPLNFVLSSGGNLTPGTISALTGLGNNTNQIQITAAIQPGSSGSPVMDKKANVVGVVAMKLDDVKMAKATGSVGQSVNFAVNGQTVKSFLDANKVPYKTGGGIFSREKSNADIAEEASKWTVLVECWK